MIQEWQWFANRDPEPMLRFVGARPAGYGEGRRQALGRRLRLFTFGCCHRIRHLAGSHAQEAMAVFERLLEETVPEAELRDAHKAAGKARTDARDAPGGEYPATCALGRAGSAGPINELIDSAIAAAREAELVAAMAAEGKRYRPGAPATAAFRVAASAERAYQVSLIHDIFGNPYRPAALEPSWLTPDVLALARGVAEEREFDRLPILADALQDAGCDNDDLLNHCRGDNPHVRGCWVIDLVLGNE